MKFCGSCGAKNRDEVKFCIKCGTPFKAVDEDADGAGSVVPDDENVKEDTLDSPDTKKGATTDGLSEAETVAEMPPPALSDFKPGMILGRRYELVRELGRGGMGIVYLARDRQLDIDVAVKVLPPELEEDIRAIKRLKNEALAAMRISHPNIMRLYNFEETVEARFLVMEYIDGPNLLKVIHEAPRREAGTGRIPQVFGPDLRRSLLRSSEQRHPR